MNTLTGDELLDLYIEAWTKLDAEIIIPHLASDFQYTSFWVLETLDRQGYTDYIRRKFESIKQSDSQILLKRYNTAGNLAIGIIQDGREEIYLRITVKDGKINSAWMTPFSEGIKRYDYLS